MKVETEPATSASPVRRHRSDRLIEALAPFSSVVLVSHVNPDPDALASMLGLEAIFRHRDPARPVTLTVDGIVARAENQVMVDVLQIPLVPIDLAPIHPGAAVVMVDSQPRTGRHSPRVSSPQAVLDHHETGGTLDGVLFRDIRPNLGATSTMVSGYLLEQELAISPRLATALLYGIETEIAGFPREATPADDGALAWLFPRADKDLLAHIRNPKLPQSYFATYQHALSNAFLYQNLAIAWCGEVAQPDLVSEIADFFVRSDLVTWAFSAGRFEDMLRLSLRGSRLDDHCGEVLREVVHGLGSAGGHDKRAGGAIPLPSGGTRAVDEILRTLRGRLLERLGLPESQGRRLLSPCPTIEAP